MQFILPESDALILEQVVCAVGIPATLRGLADIAAQWSKQDKEHKAEWLQVATAIHTCAGCHVEPLLKELPAKPQPKPRLDTLGIYAVVCVREELPTTEPLRLVTL